MKLMIMLHLLGVAVWVGGMFFAYMALRPAAASLLEPPLRLPLWSATLRRFFGWVWVSVALVLASGFYMMAEIGGVARIPPYVHIMLFIGVVMTVIFVYVYAAPFAALKRAVAGQNWKEGGAALNRIRIAVAVNLGLGLLNVAVATVGAM